MGNKNCQKLKNVNALRKTQSVTHLIATQTGSISYPTTAKMFNFQKLILSDGGPVLQICPTHHGHFS